MHARLLFVALVVAAALVGGGCTRVEQALTPEPEVVTIEATVAVPGAPVEGELDPGLPSDVPLWPNARVERTKVVNGAYELSLETDEAFDDVVAGLAAGFERTGWDVAEEPVDEGTPIEDTAGPSGDETAAGTPGRVALLTATGPTGAAIVTVTEGDGDVTISYVITSSE